jgi:hypothetical protein
MEKTHIATVACQVCSLVHSGLLTISSARVECGASKNEAKYRNGFCDGDVPIN